MFLNRNLFSELPLLLLFLLILNLFNSALESSCKLPIFLITISLNPKSFLQSRPWSATLVCLSILSLSMGSDNSICLNSVTTKPSFRCFLANVCLDMHALKRKVVRRYGRSTCWHTAERAVDMIVGNVQLLTLLSLWPTFTSPIPFAYVQH